MNHILIILKRVVGRLSKKESSGSGMHTGFSCNNNNKGCVQNSGESRYYKKGYSYFSDVDRDEGGIDISRYDVVIFPKTGNLAVWDTELKDSDDERIYAFSVQGKIMRYFDKGSWMTYRRASGLLAYRAIKIYQAWLRSDEAVGRQDFKECRVHGFSAGRCVSCNEDIVDAFLRHGVSSLWHITHINNIGEIMRTGLLSHNKAHYRGLVRTDISDKRAQQWRTREEPCYRRQIHEYVPLYIRTKNPMLYVHRELQSRLCLLEIDLSVLHDFACIFSDGNAASRATRFYRSVEDVDKLPWDVLNSRYWRSFVDGKRKMCAEVLVYPEVPVDYIRAIHCYSDVTKNLLSGLDIDIKKTPNLFF